MESDGTGPQKAPYDYDEDVDGEFNFKGCGYLAYALLALIAVILLEALEVINFIP